MIKDMMDSTDEILFNMIKLLVLLTIIGITPLYVTLGILSRQLNTKTTT